VIFVFECQKIILCVKFWSKELNLAINATLKPKFALNFKVERSCVLNLRASS